MALLRVTTPSSVCVFQGIKVHKEAWRFAWRGINMCKVLVHVARQIFKHSLVIVVPYADLYS